MRRRRLGIWIIVTVAVCAGLGAWAGHYVGGGGAGNVALIAATCAVLGSFLPGGVRLLRSRVRGRGPQQGAAGPG